MNIMRNLKKLSKIPVGLLVLDMNKEIMWCNHELLKIIELSDKDTISGESIDSVSKIQDIGLHEVLNKLFEKSAKQIVQHQLKSTKSHDPKLIEIASQPLIRDDSVIDGMIFIIKDVTREVILERKMIQDQRLENVGKIAGGIAHDFNNILAIILPNAQLLKLKLHDKPDWIKFLDTIEKAADQGASLTRKILSFSRGSGTENFEILNLNNIISDFTKMFRRVLDRKIDIVEDFEQNIWNIKADKAQIEQILMNLSVNARDSMKRGGKLFFKSMNLLVSSDVNAEFHPKLKPGKYVSLEVNDTGCGIPPKYMDRIFDPFFSGKKDGQGTGLGLSIVYGIIKSHHGFIDVRSDVGKGTNIQIYFPVSEEEPDSTEESKLDLALGSGTLLVVDDEEMIQHTLTGMLESLNYSVIVANNGKDAVDIYKSRKSEIDAILMDIQMPVMDGVEAAKKILKFDPDVKIVFMSGYAEPKSFEILKEMGYQIFLKKPYKIGNLSDILNKTLTNEISMN
jgi:two-component system cell cycle sensor histidine kinase/response regulator CckA